MEQTTIHQTVTQLEAWLEDGGYSPSTVVQFKSTTSQLLKYMNSEGIREFSMAIGLEFLRKQYSFDPAESPGNVNRMRLSFMRKLSEFQLHGAPLPRIRKRAYAIPKCFHEATEGFLAYRRFEGIVEKNMNTISLYLERFFIYLTAQKISEIPQISTEHIHGFLRFIAGFTNPTKDNMMRTVRQFLGFCFKNGFHPADLRDEVPHVHHEKRSRIPSAYSYDEVMKLLAQVDRGNPVGKRNYAILLLLAKIGIRCGDICDLKYENIDWERNVISFTQHKTGRPISLPLFEDIGLAIIDYLRLGRPKCDSPNIFIRHCPPVGAFISKSLYMMVSGYIGKAGLRTTNRKHGPHALRHSLASRLLEENVPLPVISEIMGHANVNTTAVYLSISIDKLRNCALEV